MPPPHARRPPRKVVSLHLTSPDRTPWQHIPAAPALRAAFLPFLHPGLIRAARRIPSRPDHCAAERCPVMSVLHVQQSTRFHISLSPFVRLAGSPTPAAKTAELLICAGTRRSGRLGSIENGYSQCETAPRRSRLFGGHMTLHIPRIFMAVHDACNGYALFYFLDFLYIQCFHSINKKDAARYNKFCNKSRKAI